jgi:hypothetical protein
MPQVGKGVNKMKCQISLRGCDDSTEFIVDITKEQIKFLKSIEEISEEVSTYGCMPTMIIEENFIKEEYVVEYDIKQY